MLYDETMLSRHMQPLTGSAIREIFHLLGKPGMISFAGGNPAVTALEPEVISDIAQKVLKTHGWRLLQYGATEGFAPLLESIAHFIEPCGIKARPSQILPCQGAGQALDLLVKATCNAGDAVLVESPTFLGALQTFLTYGVKLVPLPSDGEGVVVEEAEALIKAHHPKLMYIIPTFQNPSGKTLGLLRRQGLCELAARYGVVLAEDDPYRDLRYHGEALPAIKSFDQEGWVVYMGSFSKLISPGLRVGYAMSDNSILFRKLVIGKQSADVHSPLLNQAIVDEYLRAGYMPGHIARICGDYKQQLALMLDGLEAIPGIAYTKPEGGLFVWAELPEGMNATDMLREAVARNVAYVPGTHFHCEGGHHHTLRLNFSNSAPEQIRQGMGILKDLILEKSKA